MGDKNPVGQIRPTTFNPSEPSATSNRFRPNKRQLTLASLLLVLVGGLWFSFTAKSVRFVFEPESADVVVSGGLELTAFGYRLLREGTYQMSATATGYFPLKRPIAVGSKRNQTFRFELTKLPSRVGFSSKPPGATIFRDGTAIGTTPFTASIKAGQSTFQYRLDRYLDTEISAIIEGREIAQTLAATLRPAWAQVTIPTTPTSAQVLIDGEISGFHTPGPVEVLQGEHRVTVALPGYESWSDLVYVEPEERLTLDPIQLKKAVATVIVNSAPERASVTLDDQFAGVTPLQISVTPDEPHRIRVSQVGYDPYEQSFTLGSGNAKTISIELEQLTGEVQIVTEPQDAEVWIDGKRNGNSDLTLTLTALPHDIELRLEGHAGYRTSVTPQPGFPQRLRVRLLTIEEARFAKLKPTRTTKSGHELVLMSPTNVTMGASRREPGRRANEVLRTVELGRLFYLSKHEVTNEQFIAFAAGHDSGEFQDQQLNKVNQPVANVSWIEAVLYCNWLSQQENLETFYNVEFGKVVGFNQEAVGYRLPLEAEWAWVARHLNDQSPLLHFPWGEKLPPPNRHGNYADLSAQHVVGRIIFGYNDNHIASAPIGTFEANAKGIYDLGGNVSEWVHDYYVIPEPGISLGALGPEKGDYHVIRGSSWMHGTVTDLRLSFRDYGTESRQDVGFRIARFAEDS
ncbi:MAG: PEGA domain-containing protein [Pseudomonadales bacterium]|jgi:formylglycine-generating enzyme required for sulfatase activity